VRKFHEYRDNARGMTTGLCVLLAVAVIGTIVVTAVALSAVTVGCSYAYFSLTTNFKMPPGHWQGIFAHRLYVVGGLTALVVAATAVYRMVQLADGGGGWVARSLGGIRVHSDTADPAEKRLLNIVEELSIATGLKAPHVYVLLDEPGINAFAAGWNEKEAVVAVTQGAIDRLKRHQLQGIIAHEFSHIAHGDMRLNIRLLGVLAGIQAISFVARFLIRLGTETSKGKSDRGKHPLGMILALACGCVLWPVAQVGALFALVINMAVNRQREFLADATAVQYTRDPQGLFEALQLLLTDETGSRIQGAGAELASHMFFASGRSGWQRLWQTHPPLEERIRRLDSAMTSQRAPSDVVAELPDHDGELCLSSQSE
jgi:Zn-dependent protease with chaperone function